MTDLFLYTASPVFTVDGEDNGELARDLVQLDISETSSGMKSLTARFVAVGPDGGENEALLYLDGSLLDFGKSLRVALGPLVQQRVVFDGYISALEVQFAETGVPEVSICAEDKLMDLRMTRRMHSYENLSDADIAADIAANHGLAAEVDAEGPTYDRVQQWNMSDLAFLRERARRVQADVWIADETLYFQSRDKRSATELTLIRGNDLIVAHGIADLSEQRTQVKISGYDAVQRAVIDESAGQEVVQAEVDSGKMGPVVLQAAFGERVSYRVRDVPLDASEATEWARAEMLRRARRFVRVIAVSNGSPDMTVGSRLTLERMGTPFNGSGYYVTMVRHSYDLNHGHRTYFEAERANIGGQG